MSLKKHVTGEKPPNPITEDMRRKPDKGSSDNCWGRDIWWKVVDKKSPDPMGVLEEKPTLYNWGLKSQKIWFKHETLKVER